VKELGGYKGKNVGAQEKRKIVEVEKETFGEAAGLFIAVVTMRNSPDG
jgi:hypothetical protein